MDCKYFEMKLGMGAGAVPRVRQVRGEGQQLVPRQHPHAIQAGLHAPDLIFNLF